MDANLSIDGHQNKSQKRTNKIRSAKHKSEALQNQDFISTLQDITGSNIKVPITEISCNSIKVNGNINDTQTEAQSILGEFEKLVNITAKVNTTKGYVDIGKEEQVHSPCRDNLTFDSHQLDNFRLTIEQSTLLEPQE